MKPLSRFFVDSGSHLDLLHGGDHLPFQPADCAVEPSLSAWLSGHAWLCPPASGLVLGSDPCFGWRMIILTLFTCEVHLRMI